MLSVGLLGDEGGLSWLGGANGGGGGIGELGEDVGEGGVGDDVGLGKEVEFLRRLLAGEVGLRTAPTAQEAVPWGADPIRGETYRLDGPDGAVSERRGTHDASFDYVLKGYVYATKRA